MRPEIVDGSGVIALDPRERVILYLDGRRDKEKNTVAEMARALDIPLPSLYKVIQRMDGEGVIAPDGGIMVEYHYKGPLAGCWALTEDGKRLARFIHHARKVRF